MSNLPISEIIGFILLGIAVLITYFVYSLLDYLLPIGSIFIMIGIATTLHMKIKCRF